MGTAARFHFVVACGAGKLPAAAPARHLYTGAHFRYVLDSAEAEAEATRRDLHADARVWILSARYGLVHPDQRLAPYEQTITGTGAISAGMLAVQAWLHGFGPDDEVYTFLPAAYRARLTTALDLLGATTHDVYEAASGIGFQRGVCGSLRRRRRHVLS